MDTSLVVRRSNRAWPEALKREIVAASFAPGASVSVIARQYDVNANQVFAWRKRYGKAEPALTDSVSPQLLPVMITPEPPDDTVPSSATTVAMIEIGGIGRYCIRVGAGFDGAALRQVLDLLEGR